MLCIGRTQAADKYLSMLPLCLHQHSAKTIPFLTRINGGLQSVSMVSAKQLPGMMVQLSLAVVCHLK